MWQDFINMIFPRTCWTCQEIIGTHSLPICTTCQYDLPETNFHLCPTQNPLTDKFIQTNIRFALAFYYFIKEGRTQRLLHELKYQNQTEVGELLGRWYGNLLRKNDFADKFDLIVPVPLHKKKLKSRGYNQSDFWAKGLSEALQIDWKANALLKNIETESQTRKSRIERMDNVSQVFAKNPQIDLKNKHILLVDDVLTTGATLIECANVLLKAEVASVSIAVIAAA